MDKLKSSDEYQKCCKRLEQLEINLDKKFYNLNDEHELDKLYHLKQQYEKKHCLPEVKYYKSNDLLNEFSEKQIREATAIALDTRKFEIELYWKRANYFWAFIAAIYAAYFLLVAYEIENWLMYSIVSLIGVCFSFGWYLANRGSKYWQENWENHIAVLSKQTTGEIFKHWLRPADKFLKLKGNYPVSVSKVNQFLSMIVCISWMILYIISIFKWFVLEPIKRDIISWLDKLYSICNATCFSIISFLLLLSLLVIVLIWMFNFSKNKSAMDIDEHLKTKHKRHTFIRFD